MADPIKVTFDTCGWFQPGEEASGCIVKAYSPETECWWYLKNPKGIGWFTWDQAKTVSKKVALAMEIDPDKWSKTYPLSDFEAWENIQSIPEPDQ